MLFAFGIHFGVESSLPTLLYFGMFAGFIASVLWRPTVGLYLLVFTLPMQTGRYKIQEMFLGREFIDILLLGVIIGLLVKGYGLFPKIPLARYLLIFSAVLYFSLWEGSYFIHAPLPLWITDPRFSDWKNYVEMFLLSLVVATAVRNKGEASLLIIVMCASMLVVNRNYYSLMSGRDLAHFSYDVRDAGLVGYAGVNGLAALEAMFASFLIGFYSSVKNWVAKAAMLGVLATCIYCLLYAFSRGGYIGLLGGMVAVGLVKNRKLLVAVVLILISWQTLLPTSVQERILMTKSSDGQEYDSSSTERLELWEDAIALFKQNPVTGTGFGTYGQLGRVGDYKDTHNYYIKVLAETGVVGFIFFLGLLWKLGKTGLYLFRTTSNRFWEGVGLGFYALMFSAALLNFFGDRWTYQQVDGFLWVLLGCTIAGIQITTREAEAAEAEGLSMEEEQITAEPLPV